MSESENRTLNDRFMLRLPDGMRDRIKIAAVKNGRSMNAEIVSVLQEHYPEPLRVSDLEDALGMLLDLVAEEPHDDARRERLARFIDDLGVDGTEVLRALEEIGRLNRW